MNIIVAVDREWAIGKNGELLCHLPSDLKYFKEKTTGKTMIVGRKTVEGFPGARPLPNRKNLILTRDEEVRKKVFEGREYQFFDSTEEVIKYLENNEIDENDIFVAGGAEIYKQFLPFCEKAYITKIDKSFEGDAFIPNFDEIKGWTMATQSDTVCENGINYTFCIYERK